MRKINCSFLKKSLKMLAQLMGCILMISGIIFIILLTMGYRLVIIGGTFPDWNAVGALGTWLATIFAAIASVFLYNQANIHKKIDMIAKKEGVYLSLKNVFSWCEYLSTVFNGFTIQELEEGTKSDTEIVYNNLEDTILRDIKNDIGVLDTAEYIFAKKIDTDIFAIIQAIEIIQLNFRQITFIAKHLGSDIFKNHSVLEEPIDTIKKQLLLILLKKDILLSEVKEEIYLPNLEK